MGQRARMGWNGSLVFTKEVKAREQSPCPRCAEFLAEVLELQAPDCWATGWGRTFRQALEAQLLSLSLSLCRWPHRRPWPGSSDLSLYSSTPSLLFGHAPAPHVREATVGQCWGRGGRACPSSVGPVGQRTSGLPLTSLLPKEGTLSPRNLPRQ